MPDISDRTTITIDLKWIILLGTILVSAGGMIYQVKALTDEVRDLRTKVEDLDRRTIELAVTLRERTPR